MSPNAPNNLSAGPPVIVTPRLILREFVESDAADLFRLNSDPEVIRYTGDGAFSSVDTAREFIAGYDHYRTEGFGRWAVTPRHTHQFIGFCGLRRESSGIVDLGFRFFRDNWARGYATEAGHAALTLGFHDHGLDLIVGRAMRENLPSITVLQKLGMTFQEMTERGGLMWLVYGIGAGEFEGTSSEF